jgi:site-specific DNA-methyltransferase (adenine-specific)
VPFFVTDPPFGVGVPYDVFTDPNNADDYIRWFAPYIAEMKRVLQPGGMLVVCQSRVYMRHFWDWFGTEAVVTPFVFPIKTQLIWYPVVRWVKPGGKRLVVIGGHDAILGNPGHPELFPVRAVHPCPKTVGDCRQIVERYTLPGSLVVDPFCGTGSFGVACHQTGRQWIGVEISEAYHAIAVNRVREAIGHDPTSVASRPTRRA